jgi:predicted nucleotidyltransferase component of viral defense system
VQLDIGVIEKDYVLGWVLAAIAAEPALADTWIFKGGTCLRKCYYETYRFSEDLDFTVVDGGLEESDKLIEIFKRVSDWLARETGVELEIDQRTFARRRNLRGQSTT